MLSLARKTPGMLCAILFRGKLSIHKTRSYFKYFLRADQEYLFKQVARFYEHYGLDNSLIHTKYLIPEVARLVGKEARILLIGPCNMKEVDSFLNSGFTNLVAIDLVSQNKRHIREMDMHSLKFAESEFDLVYATGVLHCSHHPNLVGGEISRVLRDGGYLVAGVAINFETTDIYRIDFKNAEGLQDIFPAPKPSIVCSAIEEPRNERNPHQSHFLKVVLRFAKGKPTQPLGLRG